MKKLTRFFKDILYWSIVKVRRFASNLICVNKDLVIFDSFPDYSDNSRALSNFLLRHTNIKIIWCVQNPCNFVSNSRLRFIGKSGFINRIRYDYYSMKAKYLFSTHGAFQWANPNRQIFICLWHGTPLKKIGRLQQDNSNVHFLENCNHVLSPSKEYVEVIKKCFNKDNDSILVSGYPRNDFLFEGTDCLEKLGINKGNGKLILYLPTFRIPKGGGYIDSSQNIFEEGLINFSNKSDLKNWNEFFKDNNVFLLVKPHPSDGSIPGNLGLSNIVVIQHNLLIKLDIQLYNILHYADALLTDYSSVFCDYLFLNRPIGFILSDVEEYASNRGFVFDNALDLLPGLKIKSKEILKRFVNEIAHNIDSQKEIRAHLKPLYIDEINDNNSQRIWEIATGLSKGKSKHEKGNYLRNI